MARVPAAVLVFVGVTVPLEAIVPPGSSPLLEKSFRHPGLLISSLERPAAEVTPAPGREEVQRQLAGLGAQSGLYDWRSGGWGFSPRRSSSRVSALQGPSS